MEQKKLYYCKKDLIEFGLEGNEVYRLNINIINNIKEYLNKDFNDYLEDYKTYRRFVINNFEEELDFL